MRYSIYSNYKPSGKKFLGDIPEHWKIRKLKYISTVNFSNVDKKTVEGEKKVHLCNYVDVYKNDFITNKIEFMTASATVDEIKKFKVERGDVIITKDSEDWKDIAIPSYVSEDLNDVICGYHLAQIRAKQNSANSLYLFRSFGSEAINYQFQVESTGVTRYGLGNCWLQNGSFLIPPLDEQKSIAAFLDRYTLQIDTLIEKKQKQIELLWEKRSTLITHAVSKGLNPDVLMKDSGVEWIGNIPTNWQVMRLKYIASICTGDKDTVDRIEGGKYPFFVRSPNIERIKSYSYDGEAVLTAGDGVGVAKVFHYINGKFDYHQRVYKFSDFQHINGKYFFHFIRELFGEDILKLSAKSTVDSLRLPMIQNFPFTVPPKDEQNEIVEYIDRNEQLIILVVDQIKKSIQLLKNYRTAIITAAVTGKIDVREEVT